MLTLLSKPAQPQVSVLGGSVEPSKGLHIVKLFAPTPLHENAFRRVAKLATTWDVFTGAFAARWRGTNNLRVRFPRSAEIVQNGKKIYMPRKGYDEAGKYLYFLVEFY